MLAARDRYAELYDFAPVGYVNLDANYLIVDANLTFKRLLGLSETTDQSIRHRLNEYVAPNIQDKFYFFLQRLQRSPEDSTETAEIRMLNANRKDSFYARLEGLKSPDGLRIAVIDITDRKQAEEALAKAKDQLEERVKERTEQLQEAFDETMRSQKALEEANKQLKQYATKIIRVQEEERKRIAHELHDDTAQYLSILKMQIGALADSEEIQNPKVKEKLKYLEKDADRAFNDVRRYSHELRPITLEHQGLVAALEQIADDFNKLGRLSVEVHKQGMEPELSEEAKLGFFRIAQEAINNCRKHAKASQAKIDIRFNHRQIQMMISDNGEGFNIKEALRKNSSKGSLGLMSMKERAELIKADLKIESEPGIGTKVILKAKK